MLARVLRIQRWLNLLHDIISLHHGAGHTVTLDGRVGKLIVILNVII